LVPGRCFFDGFITVTSWVYFRSVGAKNSKKPPSLTLSPSHSDPESFPNLMYLRIFRFYKLIFLQDSEFAKKIDIFNLPKRKWWRSFQVKGGSGVERIVMIWEK
jgi:hypothetical protein